VGSKKARKFPILVAASELLKHVKHSVLVSRWRELRLFYLESRVSLRVSLQRRLLLFFLKLGVSMGEQSF